MAADDDSTPDTRRATPLAPLPDHRNVNTPWWQELWRRHAHITTPLRERGLECDIEFGLSAYIVRVSLPDDSYLIIGPPQEPPSERPPGDPEGWIVTRERNSDRSSYFERIYDSAPPAYPDPPEQPEARHGGSVQPLIAALDHHLAQLGLLPHAVAPHESPPVHSAHPSNPSKDPDVTERADRTAYAYGDVLLTLTDQLNGTNSHADAAALLHQILEPTHGLLERLGEFFEAAAEKAKEAKQDDGFDLSYDLADAAAEIRNLGEDLRVTEDRMRALTPLRPTPQVRSAPALPPRSVPPAAPRHTR
ncbi:MULTISPECIES: hypothetical protein [Streptomyces]|uniref:hypothetical protein n=1 Tax=Streptomyces TaxID=1883 RepID=UPI0004C630CA|nr:MULTISPECIES: hypothetical protein [unclassified Streptomyces]AWL37190.1 hypothetical protein B9S64_02985 [Streptomyces sp. SM18]